MQNLAFGYKTKLEQIVFSPGKLKRATQDLTRKLTKGEHMGCLSAPPKQVFKQIQADYKALADATDEARIVDLSRRVLNTLSHTVLARRRFFS